MGIEIRSVQTRRDLEDFIRFPFRLYRNDPNWVPPLLSEQRKFLSRRHNPFFDHAEVALWLARCDSQVVGTISSQVDYLHNQVHCESTGMFGFFEAMDDYAVAEALLATVRDWVRERGMTTLRGPLNFSQNHMCGLLLGGEPGPPVVMMPYNPTYYVGFFERFGLAKARDLYAYYLDLRQFNRGRNLPPELPQLMRVADKVCQRTRATIRGTSHATFREDFDKVRQIYNRSWQRNWGFVPFTDAEFSRLGGDLARILDPALALGAEIDGELVGISIGVPDINQVFKRLNGRLFPFGWFRALGGIRKISRARLMILGVIEAYRGQGIEVLLFFETIKAAVLRGYQGMEFSWVLEDNEMVNRLLARHDREFGMRVYRAYRLYEIAI